MCCSMMAPCLNHTFHPTYLDAAYIAASESHIPLTGLLMAGVLPKMYSRNMLLSQLANAHRCSNSGCLN